MAFGLETLAVGSLLFLSSSLPGWCIPETAPQINVVPTTEEVKYDFSQNSASLGQFNIEHSPYEPGTKTIVKGLHSGKIQFRTELSVESVKNNRNGRVCMYYKTINVHFHIDPTIYITNTHPPGSCEHAAIHEHELKHLMTDRQVINDYSAWIGQAIQEDFTRNGYIWGPLYETQFDSTFEEMKAALNHVVRPLIEEMTADRRARQAAIDTIEEYERVSNVCGTPYYGHGHNHKHRNNQRRRR